MTWEQTIYWLREQPEMQKLVLDAYYDDPLQSAAERYYQSSEWKAIGEMIKGYSGNALDIGAGRGISSYAFAKDGFRVYALEPDQSALVGTAAIKKLSDECGLGIDVSQGFSEKLPYPDRFFDVVFVRALLHHTSDLPDSCKEFFRVLKPGGILLAVREHVISRKADLPAFLELHPLHRYYGGENAFLLEEYLQAFQKADFKIQKIIRPLENAVNYSPKTHDEMIAEIAEMISSRLHLPKSLLHLALKNKTGWLILKRILRIVDKRPGRLYSFLCKRPN